MKNTVFLSSPSPILSSSLPVPQHLYPAPELITTQGPIIRLNPYEIHINDPEFYDEIYTNPPRKRDKYQWWVNLASAHGAAFTTVPHDLHRARRNPLNPFFSKRSVVQLEPLTRSKVETLSSRFANAADNDDVVRLDVAYMALTTDIISSYAFGEDTGYLSHPDFCAEWKQTILGGFETGALMRQFPWFLPVVKAMPRRLIEAVVPELGFLMRWQDKSKKNVIGILAESPSEETKSEAKPRTMFHALRDCDLPPSEKTLDRFCDEAEIILGAGSETTAACLSRIWFYVLSNTAIYSKLMTELETVMPQPGSEIPASPVLEKLPYLSAIISEGLRLSYSTTIRTPRVAPAEALDYHGWRIPPGTPVSETNALVLLNPTIFPEPERFQPERWLRQPGQEGSDRLDRYQVAFGKGSRQCLGINLAYSEMYLALATLWTRFDFELFDTQLQRDVVCHHDGFVAMASPATKGIRVRIRRR